MMEPPLVSMLKRKLGLDFREKNFSSVKITFFTSMFKFKIHSLKFTLSRLWSSVRTWDQLNLYGFNLHSSFIPSTVYAVEEDKSSFRATLRTETWLEDSISNSDWTKTFAAASFEL